MGVGSSNLAPSFPLRREMLAQRGSLLVSVCLVWVVLDTCFCWPTYPSLSWAYLHAVCWHVGLSWHGGVRGLPPLSCKVSVGSSPRVRGAPGVFFGLSFAVLGCPPLLLHG